MFNSLLKGHVMPAFTFEKLSPSNAHGASPAPVVTKPPAKKPRRLLGHMIDRLVEARIRKNLRKAKGATSQRPE